MMPLPALYHVAAERFQFPDREVATELLLSHGEHLDKHPKGALGLWLSPSPGLCADFGTSVAQACFASGTSFASLNLRALVSRAKELAHLSYEDAVESWSALGSTMSEHAQVVLIADETETVGEVVVLDTACLRAWQWLDAAEAAAAFQSMRRHPWQLAAPHLDPLASSAIEALCLERQEMKRPRPTA